MVFIELPVSNYFFFLTGFLHFANFGLAAHSFLSASSAAAFAAFFSLFFLIAASIRALLAAATAGSTGLFAA